MQVLKRVTVVPKLNTHKGLFPQVKKLKSNPNNMEFGVEGVGKVLALVKWNQESLSTLLPS